MSSIVQPDPVEQQKSDVDRNRSCTSWPARPVPKSSVTVSRRGNAALRPEYAGWPAIGLPDCGVSTAGYCGSAPNIVTSRQVSPPSVDSSITPPSKNSPNASASKSNACCKRTTNGCAPTENAGDTTWLSATNGVSSPNNVWLPSSAVARLHTPG